jgi:diguanylate cyclase (GGDEF)-like protein
MGDNVLMYFALKLKKTKARVIRYGGDEFILIFDRCCSSVDIDQQLLSLNSSLKNIPFCTIGEKDVYITFSFGMTTFDEGMKLEDVIEKADKEMYRHKKTS